MMQRPAGTSDNIIGLRMRMDTIGRVALLLILAEDPQAVMASAPAYQIVLGHVGTMDVQKIIAAIETAARRERFIGPEYAEEHALYHATIEALHGISRGQIALGTLLRTVGLRFSLVRGPAFPAIRRPGSRSPCSAPSGNPSREWNTRWSGWGSSTSRQEIPARAT
jgi:hut operon positive regulatory protein